jgi:hypothetical protein
LSITKPAGGHFAPHRRMRAKSASGGMLRADLGSGLCTQRLNQMRFAAAPTTQTSIVRTASSLGSNHASDGRNGRSAEVTDDEVGHGVRRRIGTAAGAIEYEIDHR